MPYITRAKNAKSPSSLAISMDEIDLNKLDRDVRWDEYGRKSPFQTPIPKVAIIAEYFRLVNAIFWAYLAINASLHQAVQMLECEQEKSLRTNKTTIEELDKGLLFMSKFDPSKPSPYPDPKDCLHYCSQGGFKKKNAPGGENPIMAANMCIVMMYTYWEDHYREKIAHAAGLRSKNEIKIDIMDDLRILRNSIIHHNGYVKIDKKCKILTWFKPSDKINVDLGQFAEIKLQIEKGLSELSQELEKIVPSSNGAD
jgi:hypothetical protein